jgi:hypothetical protein
MTATVIEFPKVNHKQAMELFRQWHEWLTTVQGFTAREWFQLSLEDQVEWLYTWDAEKAEKLRVYLHAVNQ